MHRLACLGFAFLVACGSDSRTVISLNVEQALPSEAHGIVWLWGFDEQLADAEASLIASYDQPIAGRGLAIDTPDNPHELIDQGRGPVPASQAKFYFSFFVDLDGDGELCPGDLREDVGDFTSYSALPETVTVVMEEIEADRPCEPIVPN